MENLTEKEIQFEKEIMQPHMAYHYCTTCKDATEHDKTYVDHWDNDKGGVSVNYELECNVCGSYDDETINKEKTN